MESREIFPIIKRGGYKSENDVRILKEEYCQKFEKALIIAEKQIKNLTEKLEKFETFEDILRTDWDEERDEIFE